MSHFKEDLLRRENKRKRMVKQPRSKTLSPGASSLCPCQGEERGELLFNGDRASVWDGENLLEIVVTVA